MRGSAEVVVINESYAQESMVKINLDSKDFSVEKDELQQANGLYN